MDGERILERAVGWAQGRGWKSKLAKSRSGQSLFEHALIELDVLLELCPILGHPKHYGLTQTEEQILGAAVLVHDVGKERDAWQAYIRHPSPDRWVSHVVPELTQAVVGEVCAALGFDDVAEPVERTMAHCAEFHHNRPGRSDGAILDAMLFGSSDRFLTLAHLVKAIDQFCSAPSASEAVETAQRHPGLGNHVRVTAHEVIPRGVSTAFVHRAAQQAFEELNWRPLLYFSNATVYGADLNDSPRKPSMDEIRVLLEAEIDGTVSRDVTALMVGSPTGNILPKPDLFSFAESRQYLESAGRKISSQSFARKPLPARRKVVQNYWGLRNRTGKPTDAEVEREAGRISVAQPEMLVFKFFKAMMDPEKVEAIGADGAALARKLYEETFGSGSWAGLHSTSTLMPAKDMAKTVDYFWALSGKAVGRPEVSKVEELPDDVRLKVLVDVLEGIARAVYAALGCPSPRDRLSKAMAVAFSQDVLVPSDGGDVRTFAQRQLDHYCQSKPFAGKESPKGVYLCPICNSAFGGADGKKASADFIENPQAHTNRGVSHGRFGYIMVCVACYYERLLRQILMGSRPAEVITLLPRLNLGPTRGERLLRSVREWVETARGQMRGDTGSLEWGFSLGFSEQTARQIRDRDPFGLGPEDLVSLFRYRFTADTQKKRTSEVLRRLREEFDGNLDALREASGQSFATWEDAVEALIENRVAQQEFKAIRKEVFRLHETIHLVCETPNVIFIPLNYEIAAGNDESDTSKALRGLYVALILSAVFDAAVAVQKEAEPAELIAGRGAAYVPPVAAVRALIRNDWVPVVEAKRWLAAIGAASMLVLDTGLPVRSALYQILAADPAEKIARRIENELGQSKLTAVHLQLITQLPGFATTSEEEVRS